MYWRPNPGCHGSSLATVGRASCLFNSDEFRRRVAGNVGISLAYVIFFIFSNIRIIIISIIILSNNTITQK